MYSLYRALIVVSWGVLGGDYDKLAIVSHCWSDVAYTAVFINLGIDRCVISSPLSTVVLWSSEGLFFKSSLCFIAETNEIRVNWNAQLRLKIGNTNFVYFIPKRPFKCLRVQHSDADSLICGPFFLFYVFCWTRVAGGVFPKAFFAGSRQKAA